jgi:hypothetical protein
MLYTIFMTTPIELHNCVVWDWLSYLQYFFVAWLTPWPVSSYAKLLSQCLASTRHRPYLSILPMFFLNLCSAYVPSCEIGYHSCEVAELTLFVRSRCRRGSPLPHRLRGTPTIVPLVPAAVLLCESVGSRRPPCIAPSPGVTTCSKRRNLQEKGQMTLSLQSFL